jgi:CDP-glycerol glycerophosphotransferase (TagB/SpsB family)
VTRLRALLGRLSGAGTFVADQVVPKAELLVVRTVPDFDDQGVEFVRQWGAASEVPVIWLADAVPADGPPPKVADCRERFGDRFRVLPIRSVRGYWAYFRARVVVHTTGTHNSHRGSRRKVYVNLWHGMPLKRLRPDAPAGRRQTDLLLVTSAVHARNFSQTWDLTANQVAITGLPRNDALLRASAQPRPASIEALTGGRPLVLWLPTFRESVGKIARSDGRDFGNVFQMPAADVDDVAEHFDRLGLHVLVKPHPKAPTASPVSLPGLSIWTDQTVQRSGMSLYEILGHADVLLTDHSSVWVDYLLVRRPMIFTIADLDAYAQNRGHYFTPLTDYLPGPVATTMPELYTLLAGIADVTADWRASRDEALTLHHDHVDARSSERAVRAVAARSGLPVASPHAPLSR